MTQHNSATLTTGHSALQSYNHRHMRVLKLSVLSLALLLVSSTASSFSTRSSLLPPSSSAQHLRLTTKLRGGSELPPHELNNHAEEGTTPVLESTTSMEKSTLAAVANDHMGRNAAPPGALRRAFPHVAWHRLPNLLTYLRCLAIPVMVIMFYMPDYELRTAILFALASVTDWLDGHLARRWDITSSFGAFLDPVADKLMVSTSLILLTGRRGKILAIPSCIILAREIAVSALREWMAQRGLRDAVKVGFQGKLKTAASMIALTLLLSVPTNSGSAASPLYMPSVVMLYFCALVTVTSGSVYFRAAAPVLLDSQ